MCIPHYGPRTYFWLFFYTLLNTVLVFERSNPIGSTALTGILPLKIVQEILIEKIEQYDRFTRQNGFEYGAAVIQKDCICNADHRKSVRKVINQDRPCFRKLFNNLFSGWLQVNGEMMRFNNKVVFGSNVGSNRQKPLKR